MGYAKSEVNFSVDPNMYYSYMRSILYRSFLKLESVIVNECKMKTIESEDFKSPRFKGELCKCELWMQKEELKTFHEFIRSVYDLNPQPVSKGDTLRLYKAVLGHWETIKVKAIDQTAGKSDKHPENQLTQPSEPPQLQISQVN